jgi:hypothetical protein
MTVNCWGADNPLNETKGGLAQSSYSKGDILYCSAANTLSKLAIGADNEVLKLASGLPSWAAASGGGGGGWVPLAAASASASANINFDSTYITSTYDLYIVQIFTLQGSADADLQLVFSPDNGSTIRTTGYESAVYSANSTSETSATDAIDLSRDPIGGTADEGEYTGLILIANASDSGIKTHVGGWAGFINDADANESDAFYGCYDTAAETHNYIRFQMDSGNIATGEFYLYGAAKS